MFRYEILCIVSNNFCLLVSIFLSKKKWTNEWFVRSWCSRKQERKYTQPAHKKKYTTITTSRRNKNNNKFSVCECTNENNNKKQKHFPWYFFQSWPHRKSKLRHIWIIYTSILVHRPHRHLLHRHHFHWCLMRQPQLFENLIFQPKL